MLNKCKNILIALAGITLLLTPAMVPAMASAQDISGNLCQGTNLSISGGTGSCSADTGSFQPILTKIVNIFSAIVGVVAVIMIIVGGLKYITSGGDSSKVSGARNSIVFALVGLIIVALAQVIVHFVLTNVGG